MQLDFIDEMTECKIKSQQVNELLTMCHKLRKSVFAQLNEHDKLFMKLQEQLDYIIEKQLIQIK